MAKQNEPAAMWRAARLHRLMPSVSVDPTRTTLLPVADIVGLFVTRARLEQAADIIIELLDHLGGDPDNEPSLGSIGNTAECLSLDQRR